MKTPMIVTLTQHIIFTILCRTSSSPILWPIFMGLKARLADARALRAASAMEYCDYLQSSSMMPDFPDLSSLQ